MCRKAFTLMEVLVVLVVIGILLALILPAVQAAREAARRSECRSHLRQMGIGMHAYHAVHGMYPPGGSRGISLHAFLLPYIDQPALYNQIKFALGIPPHETPVKDTLIPLYVCPSDPSRLLNYRNADDPSHSTGYGSSYAGNSGTGVLKYGFNGVFRHLAPAVVVGVGRGGPIADRDISDGASHTIAVSEILMSDSTHARLRKLWDTPGGKRFYPEEYDEFVELCRNVPDDAGGTPWFRGRPWTWGDSGNSLYNHMLTPSQKSCWNNGSMQYGAYTAASLHPGGVHSLFVDGHVNSVSDKVDIAVWRAMGSRDGNEVLE